MLLRRLKNEWRAQTTRLDEIMSNLARKTLREWIPDSNERNNFIESWNNPTEEALYILLGCPGSGKQICLNVMSSIVATTTYAKNLCISEGLGKPIIFYGHKHSIGTLRGFCIAGTVYIKCRNVDWFLTKDSGLLRRTKIIHFSNNFGPLYPELCMPELVESFRCLLWEISLVGRATIRSRAIRDELCYVVGT